MAPQVFIAPAPQICIAPLDKAPQVFIAPLFRPLRTRHTLVHRVQILVAPEVHVKPHRRPSASWSLCPHKPSLSMILRRGGESQQQFWAWDDVSGQALDAEEVTKARAKEMTYIADKEVWRKIPRSAAQRNGWRIIPTRWVDINKGSAQDPCYRSRLVAKEFNTGAQEGLFAATPPLEAVRPLLSDAATAWKARPNEDRVIMVNDVARAFFEAPMKRYVCVELPPEARAESDAEDYVGLLLMSLYGTRDAAANFQAEVRKFMLSQGVRQAPYSPSIFWHPGRDLRTLVHGDDFMTSGNRTNARWFRNVLES